MLRHKSSDKLLIRSFNNYSFRANNTPGTIIVSGVRKRMVHKNVKVVVHLKFIFQWKVQIVIKNNKDTT